MVCTSMYVYVLVAAVADSEHDDLEEGGEEAGEEQDDVENEAEDEGGAEDEQEEETESAAKPRKRKRRSSAQVLNVVFSFLLHPVLPNSIGESAGYQNRLRIGTFSKL